MFKLRFQIPNKPAYQPPTPNIQIQPKSPLVNPVMFGNIYGAMLPTGPCSSCGNSK